MNVLSTALSGLQSAQLRLDSTAHNVANLATPGFRRQEAVAEARPEGGVNTRLQKAEQPRVNLEEEAVEQMSASVAYRANLQVVRTTDRTLGALLNEKA